MLLYLKIFILSGEDETLISRDVSQILPQVLYFPKTHFIVCVLVFKFRARQPIIPNNIELSFKAHQYLESKLEVSKTQIYVSFEFCFQKLQILTHCSL